MKATIILKVMKERFRRITKLQCDLANSNQMSQLLAIIDRSSEKIDSRNQTIWPIAESGRVENLVSNRLTPVRLQDKFGLIQNCC